MAKVARVRKHYVFVEATPEEKIIFKEAGRIWAEKLGVLRLSMSEWFRQVAKAEVERLRKEYEQAKQQ